MFGINCCEEAYVLAIDGYLLISNLVDPLSDDLFISDTWINTLLRTNDCLLHYICS